jgi:hypothetical protein
MPVVGAEAVISFFVLSSVAIHSGAVVHAHPEVTALLLLIVCKGTIFFQIIVFFIPARVFFIKKGGGTNAATLCQFPMIQ